MRANTGKAVILIEIPINKANGRNGVWAAAYSSYFEFSSSVKSLRDSLNSYNDSQPLLDLWYALKAVNKNLYSPEDIAEKISAVTRDEIIAAANGVKLHTVYKLLPKEEK